MKLKDYILEQQEKGLDISQIDFSGYEKTIPVHKIEDWRSCEYCRELVKEDEAHEVGAVDDSLTICEACHDNLI